MGQLLGSFAAPAWDQILVPRAYKRQLIAVCYTRRRGHNTSKIFEGNSKREHANERKTKRQ